MRYLFRSDFPVAQASLPVSVCKLRQGRLCHHCGVM